MCIGQMQARWWWFAFDNCNLLLPNNTKAALPFPAILVLTHIVFAVSFSYFPLRVFAMPYLHLVVKKYVSGNGRLYDVFYRFVTTVASTTLPTAATKPKTLKITVVVVVVVGADHHSSGEVWE